MRGFLRNFVVAVSSLMAGALLAYAHPPAAELSKMLPRQLGGFHQLLSMRPLLTLAKEELLIPSRFRVGNTQGKSPFIGAEVDYLSPTGKRFTVEIVQLRSDSDAYSFFTFVVHREQEFLSAERAEPNQIGTASLASQGRIAFFKGTTFLRVTGRDSDPKSAEELPSLARLFAETIDKGEGSIPVLVKHLPNWQDRQHQVQYAVSLESLRYAAGNQPVFDAVSFEGGGEAVIAPYGASQLVLIEFSTPQLAGDNDRRIVARIQELWKLGQPAPSAYRRVGNYSVFVFNGQTELAAAQLIDQVKYEQVVQWLGENPYLLQEAQRQYTETTLGVFIAVVKASGLALLICFSVGSLFGAFLFSRRRAQQKAFDAFSDAGGMLRLNLDEMTPQTDPARLIGRGN